MLLKCFLKFPALLLDSCDDSSGTFFLLECFSISDASLHCGENHCLVFLRFFPIRNISIFQLFSYNDTKIMIFI